ncbi:ATP-binding protein [Candidatus Skiveiella danica]|jgi:signal transduction histidine kinase|uniref:sensor histidine kinase n=1 Tax=Candidatus Skiveiella danica TaxID=3386177 RepID=UPI0009C5880B|nr:MAG: Sensor protein FixL [Alphaproteobacteria bacterium ADurb.Bin100]
MLFARMLRSAAGRILCLCCLAHAFALAPLAAMADHRAANVLVIYSNGRLLPANVEGDRGLREALSGGAGPAVNVFDEFLDIPRFSGPAYLSAVTTYLQQKYGSHPPDVIVAGGAEALAFALEHRAALFPDAPIVHMSVPKANLGTLAKLPPDVVGTPIEFDFDRTIEQARRWHPQARRLVLVTGAAAQDRAWEARLRDASPRLGKDWETVEFLAGLPTSAVLRHLEKLPGESVVFTPGYWQDGEGRRFTPRESTQALVAASSAPVYVPFNTFVGIGVVGGYMLDFEGIGRQAGRTVNEVLHGAASASAAATATMPNVLNVDWRQVRRWGIDERAIPDTAVVHFREPGLWEAHRLEVLLAVCVVLLQTGLIAGLIVERRRRKLAVQAEQKQRFELVHASRVAVVGELTGAIAHEINQPLGAILSNAEAAEMILASGARRPDELRQILADIRRDDLRASEVIRRLRALLAKHQVEHQRFNLNEAVGDVTSILRAEARRRGATLEILLPNPAVTMVGDRIQIQQVLINLVLNALEAVAELPEPRRRVSVEVEKTAGRVTLLVRDRGTGIAPDQMPRLFDSFFSTKSTGMGLGLSIVRTLVEAHGGRVTAENGVDGGAVFRVELPAAGANGKKKREQT